MDQDLLKKLVVEFIQYYNSFEIDKMMNLFTDDCIFENISNSSGSIRCHGKQELRSVASQSVMLFNDRKQTVTNWVLGKDKIAVEIDYVATLATNLPNGLKAGDLLRLKGVSIYEFKDKKIKRLIDFS